MAPINPTFSRYKFAPKAGSVLKYIKNQGYIAAPAPVQKAAASAVAPASQSFNFGQALGNEGIYQGDLAGIKADNEVAQKQRDNAVKGLQFQFNDPSNPFNTLGEMGRQLKETKGNFIANRAARGVAQSGGTTLGQMQIGHDYSKGLYDATNQFNSQVGGLDNSLAETLRANAGRQGQALTDATGRLIDNGVGLGTPFGASPGGAPGAPGAAPASPATQAYQQANAALAMGQATPEQIQLAQSGAPAGTAQAAALAARGGMPVPNVPVSAANAAADARYRQGFQTYLPGSKEQTIHRIQKGRNGEIIPVSWEQHLKSLVAARRRKAGR